MKENLQGKLYLILNYKSRSNECFCDTMTDLRPYPRTITIHRRLLIGGDGRLHQSEAYDVS